MAGKGKRGTGRTAYRDEDTNRRKTYGRRKSRDMATTETGAASYRVTGRDEDDDKRSTHHRHRKKSRRTQDTGLARARREPRAGCRRTGERRA